MPVDKKALQKLVLDALDELKAQDVVELDVQRLTDVTDSMIIASGRSGRQVKALAETVVEKAKAAGVKPMGVEGLDAAEWVLVDLCDVVVHVMQPDIREYYQIEKLWAGVDAADRKSDHHASMP